MKRLKTAWAVLLCLCMAVTLLPITAFAAENYGVTVNNIAVTDENADDVLGDSTVSYDVASNTLMLNGTNLTQIQNNTGKDFTIKLCGENTVAITAGSTNLIESNSPLTITGDASASLKLSGVNQNSYIKCIDAKGSVTVEIVTLILTNSNNAGISTTGDITVKNGATVKGDTGYMFHATTSGAGKLTIEDSTVTAPLEGTTVSGWMSAWVNEMDISNSTVNITVANGIYAANDIIIRDNSNITMVASGTATPYPGIYAGGSMTITGSTVEGVSYTFSGLYAKKDLTITDSNVKAVTTSKSNAALGAGGNLKISGITTVETEAESGVGYSGNVIFEVKTPAEPAEAVYDVYAGESKEAAKKIEGSPFASGTDITEKVKDSKYFSIAVHNHVVDDTVWFFDETSHWNICEYGEKVNEAAHTFRWVTDKEPTATEAGSRHEECTVCGYVGATETIAATGTEDTPSDDPHQTEDTPSDNDQAEDTPSATDDTTDSTTGDKTNPETGDSSNIMPWIALLLLSSGGLAGVIIPSRNRKAS